jgi:uncharacterized protein (TIGR03089 family)
MHQLSAQPATPEALFDRLVAAEPSRPFVTYYDEATGERTELSVKSLGNWVAKTYHLLGTELGLGAGDVAAVDLPAHWLSVPVVLGCFAAGLELGANPAAADVVFVRPGVSADSGAEVYHVTPVPAAGSGDYISAVRPQADAWASVRPVAGVDDPGWNGLTRGETVAAARRRADELGLGPGARVLTDRGWHSPADWLDTLLAPLVVGGSVVYVANAVDPAVLDRRVTQERATACV